MVRVPAFQAGYAGSIPVTRSERIPASGRAVGPQGGGNSRDGLVGDGHDLVCFAGRDVGKVGRIARIDSPLLETLAST